MVLTVRLVCFITAAVCFFIEAFGGIKRVKLTPLAFGFIMAGITF